MHPNSTKPKFKLIEFKQNATRPNIFDLVPGSGLNIFDSVELTNTKSEHLKSNGAQYVLTGYKGGKKSLHSGLLKHPTKAVMFGDHFNQRTGKKSFFMVSIKEQKITMLYFRNKFVSPQAARSFIDIYVYK
jgi:hypothetical protein